MKLTITDDRNEVDKNAMGGTELMGAGLQKYVKPELLEKFNIIRSRVRHIDPEKPNILWLHDLPGDPESAHLRDPESLKRFAKIVYVSNWQKDMYQNYLGVPASKGTVIKNAIEPIPESMIKPPVRDGKIRLVYHPTPHRGLEILVPVFIKLCEEFPQLQLDVFSSFALYGWEQRDEQYRQVIDMCKNHPNIGYWGSQPQEVVRAALGGADIFAYPSIWQETSCICAMEAMSAKCLMIMPNYAALPETTAGFAVMYDWTEDMNEHANRFYGDLRAVIRRLARNPTGFDSHLEAQKEYADKFYCWERNRDIQWNLFLHDQLIHSN
jgi:glycosyltransferase involved in cell wall biosynthesis